MNTHELWQAVLGELELSLSKANFTTWFKNTFISSIEDEKVAISVPNTFTKAWLEKKYNQSILKSIQTVSNLPIKGIIYKVDVRPPQSRLSMQAAQIPTSFQTQPSGSQHFYQPSVQTLTRDPGTDPSGGFRASSTDSKLNPKYVFESFIVGKGSELAHAAAAAVAENPGTKYNPLFIYGGVGLGKTHLIQALGNAVISRQPSAKILYVT